MGLCFAYLNTVTHVTSTDLGALVVQSDSNGAARIHYFVIWLASLQFCPEPRDLRSALLRVLSMTDWWYYMDHRYTCVGVC